MEPLRNPWPESTTVYSPPEVPDHTRPRSSTALHTSHPPLLTPARPFAASTPTLVAPVPPPLPSAPIPPRLPYPQNYVSSNLRRARTASPVPPRPYASSSSPNPPPVPLQSKPARPVSYPELRTTIGMNSAEPLQDWQEDDGAELAELAAVIALSQAETVRQEKLKQKAINQEEADLAAALKASMISNPWTDSYFSAHTTAAGSSLVPSAPELLQMDYTDDATFARMLAVQAPTPTESSFTSEAKSEPPNQAESVHPPADVGSPSRSPHQSGAPLPAPAESSPLSDEQLALRFAVEEKGLVGQSKDDKPPLDSPDLALYLDAKLSSTIDKKMQMQMPIPVLFAVPQRPASVDTATSSSHSDLLKPPESLRSDSSHSDLLKPPESLRSASSSTSLRSEESDRPANANQFVDADLLLGVSIGFVAPSITPEPVPMPGTMPNIIALPYGRCPPLHLQAPNWRHLLKLMARLSATRIEPTVEAIAVTRSPHMQLRTVVQFVRPHVSSPHWRALLWLTIEHPVPPSIPNARKYTSGDTSVLPWSYTLSSVPTLLRDGADTMLSKCYTIPSTDSVPLPTLPISFPNLAMYLQAALEESRRNTSDSSTGIRRLGKMMAMCYPTENLPGEDDGERSRVDRLFKKVKVIGRGGRRDKKAKGGNEDTYELVTPFVLDEWGP